MTAVAGAVVRQISRSWMNAERSNGTSIKMHMCTQFNVLKDFLVFHVNLFLTWSRRLILLSCQTIAQLLHHAIHHYSKLAELWKSHSHEYGMNKIQEPSQGYRRPHSKLPNQLPNLPVHRPKLQNSQKLPNHCTKIPNHLLISPSNLTSRTIWGRSELGRLPKTPR